MEVMNLKKDQSILVYTLVIYNTLSHKVLIACQLIRPARHA